MRLHNLFEDQPKAGDIIQIEMGDVMVEGIFVEQDDDGISLQLDEKGQDYLTELLPLIPLAVGAAGGAWSAYDAYKAKKAYDRGEITGAELAKQIGTDAALTVAGGGVAKAAVKGGKAAVAGIKKAFNKTPNVDIPDAPKTTDAPVNLKRKKKSDKPGVGSVDTGGSSDLLQRTVKQVSQFESEEFVDEAEYQGRKVKLNKPMRGDVKKSKVYVKNPKGNVVKVNFGHGGTSAKRPTMKIRKNNPKARKSFRARHNCDNPGPKHKARYWSCKAW